MSEAKVEIAELLEVQKVWILMQMYWTCTLSLYNKLDLYGPIRKIKLAFERYKVIMNSLGGVLPQIDIFEGSQLSERAGVEAWGKFNQFISVTLDLESFIGKVGRKFLFHDMDLTRDDDKLRHSSKKFRDEGLQMSGFRGSRIGQVMNGLGNTQTGMIYSRHFS